MKTRKKVVEENYLERIPLRADGLVWTTDEAGAITLEIENRGWMNRLAQKFFRRPKRSYVHLDEMGSFIWPLLSEEQNIILLGKQVEEHFGDAAHPLYERLVKYFEILDSYHFITWKD